jgi:dTDP-D-glucose 4,6-dehydratase
LNNQKARKELGWYPKLNFEETIKLTVDWYKVLERNGNFEKITKDQIEFFMKKKS